MPELLKQTPNIIVDLDGTLALESHRRELIGTHGWEAYFAGIRNDPINQSVARLMHMLAPTHKIHIFTSRPEQYRKVTETWLLDRKKQDHVMEMRPDEHTNMGEGDWQKHKSDHDIKAEMLDAHNLHPDNVMCVLEDRDEMVNWYRQLGFNCWQVHEEGEMYVPK